MSRLRPIRPSGDRLRDALIAALGPHAGPFATLAATSRSWSSGLFDGARHRIALRLDGEDAAERAERLAERLPETELPIPHGFVADVQVTWRLGFQDPPPEGEVDRRPSAGGGGVEHVSTQHSASGGDTPPPCFAWSPSPYRGGFSECRSGSVIVAIEALTIDVADDEPVSRAVRRAG
jgi:hypothetical protein